MQSTHSANGHCDKGHGGHGTSSDEHGRIRGSVHQIVDKLESQRRRELLQPAKTLALAGITQGMSVVDIGAGSGLFTLEVAKMPETRVVAIDANSGMLDYIASKADELGLGNIECLNTDSVPYSLQASSVDAVIMVHVFHEFDPEVRDAVASEVSRILVLSGRLLLIDFPADPEVSGPPLGLRVDRSEADRIFGQSGLVPIMQLNFGSEFYGVVYQRQ